MIGFKEESELFKPLWPIYCWVPWVYLFRYQNDPIWKVSGIYFSWGKRYFRIRWNRPRNLPVQIIWG